MMLNFLEIQDWLLGFYSDGRGEGFTATPTIVF